MLFFQTLLLTLPLLFKIHHRHNLLSIILYYVSLHLTLSLLKIHQLNKLFNIILLHLFILQSLILTPRTIAPSLPNPLTAHALQSHSPPRVSSPMSPPYTALPPQNPPKALKKQDVIVDEPSTDPNGAVEKFFSGLKKYKHKKSLEDLAILAMTVKNFGNMVTNIIWNFCVEWCLFQNMSI
jgi:hypothetical protein